MNLFYNEKGVGDVLLAQLTTENPNGIIASNCGDVTMLRDEKSETIIGFNLFHATSYVDFEGNGEVKLTEEIVGQIQQALVKNGVDFTLEVDLSPKFVVGHVLEKAQHPNADKLSVCSIDVGTEIVQIVCGAKNIAAGQKVVVAKVGAVMPSGMIIRDAELRGTPSAGMVCSASELSLPDAKENVGILVLEDNAVVGEAFIK